VFLLLFVFFAGGLGDVVSRAYRFVRSSLRVETAPRAEEAPLGIRVLLLQGSSLLAQVVLGGTAAVVIYIIVRFVSPDLDPVAFGIIGFLVGYSEAFFSRLLRCRSRYIAEDARLAHLLCSLPGGGGQYRLSLLSGPAR
jgi:hypothetical protein